jgi:hypothetical protein
MAIQKLIKVNTDGSQQEYVGKTVSGGAGDVGEFPVLDAAGRLDNSMMPVGLGADSITATTGEALSAGDFVYISAAGLAFKADADAIAKAAVGYVIAGFGSGAVATIYFDDQNTGLAGLTVGSKYYLSQTAGAITLISPTATGSISQSVGVATSATSLRVRIGEPIIRA